MPTKSMGVLPTLQGWGIGSMAMVDHITRAPWTYQAQPLFAIGAARSGTTWLQAMLATHPEIHTGPEVSFFLHFRSVFESFHYPKERRKSLSAYMTQEKFYRWIAENYWAVVSSLPEPATPSRYFLDKTPNNSEYGAFIVRTFPSARFIHIIRDGRAVVASILKASRTWAKGHSWAPRTTWEATKLRKKRVLAAREIAKLVSGPERYYEVKYEDLRASGHQHLERLFEWLGLSATEDLIHRAIQSNSLERVTSSPEGFASIPMPESRMETPKERVAYPEGFFGSGACEVGDYELTRLQRVCIERWVGKLLIQLGYPEVSSHVSLRDRLILSGRIRRMLRLTPI